MGQKLIMIRPKAYGKESGKLGRTKPLSLTWTNKNVKALGVYFGNDNPTTQAYLELMPKIITSLNYWKQFRLSKLAKSRVIEIFHASKLWYVNSILYPQLWKGRIQKAFFDYINYPHKMVTICQDEMYKLREHGGAKLSNIHAKSEASKIQWLIELCSNPNLATHLALVNELLGEQKGGIQGTNFFSPTNIMLGEY